MLASGTFENLNKDDMVFAQTSDIHCEQHCQMHAPLPVVCHIVLARLKQRASVLSLGSKNQLLVGVTGRCSKEQQEYQVNACTTASCNSCC